MDNFNKHYPVCVLENLLAYTMQNFCSYIKYFFANNYLISSPNRRENTAQYSINNQATMLH